MSENEIKNETYENVVKIGTFQLQTKSFWFGVISILSAFLIIMIWMNSYYWYNIIKDINEVNKALVQKINTNQSHSTESK